MAITAVSLLLLAFVAQAMVFSALQHQRDLVVGYDQLRATLAKGETPVGQLDVNGDLVAPGTPVALLQIPQLGVSEVVREGTTAAVLRSGPGHRRDTVMPGQAGTSVIMGRQTSYGGPFAEVGRLTPGSSIVVTTGQGAATVPCSVCVEPGIRSPPIRAPEKVGGTHHRRRPARFPAGCCISTRCRSVRSTQRRPAS